MRRPAEAVALSMPSLPAASFTFDGRESKKGNETAPCTAIRMPHDDSLTDICTYARTQRLNHTLNIQKVLVVACVSASVKLCRASEILHFRTQWRA